MQRGKSKNKLVIAEVPQVIAPNFTMNPADLKNFLPVDDFIIKRVYWIIDPKKEMKSSQHAHKDDENEIFVVMNGSCTLVCDEGGGIKEIPVKRNNIMFIPRMIWHGFKNMSADFILLALTTTNYDPERKGYIEDYQEFKDFLEKTK